MDGQGEMVYSNGVRYKGQWVEGKRYGYGVLVWPNGNIFEGAFLNNELVGEGTYY